MFAKHNNISGMPSIAYDMQTIRPQEVFGAMFPYPKMEEIYNSKATNYKKRIFYTFIGLCSLMARPQS
jgi:hypothetical protein